MLTKTIKTELKEDKNKETCEIKNTKQKIINIQNLILYFFTAGFLGWVLEMAFAILVTGQITERGFLYGPICPIYGFGVLILLGIHNFTEKRKIKHPLLIFILISLLFSVLEYFSSVILELLFNMRWWDYSNMVLNFQGRISLMYSISFGVIGVIFIKLLNEPIKKIITKVRTKVSIKGINIFIIVLKLIFITDIVFSILRHA